MIILAKQCLTKFCYIIVCSIVKEGIAAVNSAAY